ncbi:MAG: efflux RND transporter periplasmic adaptor subunit [Planctomycetia bacterium]|nr:MAG: efflux RND transporter periplasmic adaptor subunit [Planctomycetia bacterium]
MMAKTRRRRPGVGPQRAAAGVLGVWLLLAVGCTQKNEYESPPPPQVTVARPLQETVTNYLEETGTTEPVEMVEIRARVQGFLEKVNFEPGTDVSEGELLYVIQQREFEAKAAAARADVAAKKAEVERAEIEYQRQERLQKENATAEVAVVQAKADQDAAVAALDASKAALDQTELDLDYTEVRTPISGRVGKTLVKAGNLVGAAEATHLTTVVKYDPIYANFNINERALLELLERAPRDENNRIKEREIKVFLRRANDKGFPFEGHVEYADLAVDQSTGTYLIRGIFPNQDRRILPGLFVRVRIPIGRTENAILVPERALGADQAGRYVLVVDKEGMVQRRNITMGAKHGEMVVVDEGLKADQWVIIDGVQRSRPGAKVDPQKTELPRLGEEVVAVETGSQSPIEAEQEEAAEPGAENETDGAAEESSAESPAPEPEQR